jgi:hypothetical protein
MTYLLQRLGNRGYERRPVSPENYRALSDALQGAKTLVVIEERLNLLLGNYREFEKGLLDLALDRALFLSTDLNLLRDGYYEVNRLLLNVMAAARLYLDHVPHLLGAFPSGSGGGEEAFQNARKRQFGERFGFRVLEALRNYAQHREFPAHSVSAGSRVDRSAAEHRVLYSVTPYVVLARLREDGKFKASTLKELEATGQEQVSLTPLVREYMSGIGHVHLSIREGVGSDLKRWAERIDWAIREVTGDGKDRGNLIRLLAEGDDGVQRASHDVFSGNIDRIRWLQDRNANPVSFEVLAVSSAPEAAP